MNVSSKVACRRRRSGEVLVGALALAAVAGAAHATVFSVTNITSSGAPPAAHTDGDLSRPWGLASSPTSPFWVANHGNDLSTLYNTAGAKQGLVVTTLSGGLGAAGPTGVVFNTTPSFLTSANSHAAFLFATESGAIDAWAGSSGTIAGRVVNKGDAAVYTGLAVGNDGAQDLLYAANFRSGQVEIFNSNYTEIGALGADPHLPSGYSPYNVQNLGGSLFVAFAKLDASQHDAVSGAGFGFVDQYSTGGVFQRRIASGGPLDTPWGMAIAPSAFGDFAGDLLVGNAGDGTINAYDLTTLNFMGKLRDTSGHVIAEAGLRGLLAGNGGNGGVAGDLYLTAGGANGGLLGEIAPSASTTTGAPEPGAWALMLTGFAGVGAALRRRRQTSFTTIGCKT